MMTYSTGLPYNYPSDEMLKELRKKAKLREKMDNERLKKKEIIEDFYNNKLTKIQKQNVIIKTVMVKIVPGIWDEKSKNIKIGGIEEQLWLSGEGKCNLDNATIKKVKELGKAKCKVLMVNLESDLAEAMGLTEEGYYHYNSDRLEPDSVIALKFL